MAEVSDEPGSERRLRVVLVEDEGLFRDLLRVSLAQYRRIEVVGAFADGASALAAAPKLQPDVALLDIELQGDLNGVQVGLELRRLLPRVGIVLLSNHQDPEFLAAVPAAEVIGWSYLLKKSVTDVGALERAIEGSASGLVVLDPRLVTRARQGHTGLLARLTPRQREILALIAQGYTNSAIAERLVLAEKSVENQINVLYQQLDINRSDAAIQPRATAVLMYLKEVGGSPMGDVPRRNWGG